MRKPEEKEKEIEWLLSKLPKVKDERDPNIIYSQIQSRRVQKRNRKIRWMPIITSACALFIFSILSVSYLFDEEKTFNKDQQDQKSMDITMNEPEATSEKKEASHKEEVVKNNARSNEPSKKEYTNDKGINRSKPFTTASSSKTSLLFSDSLADESYFTVAIPDEQSQYIVPVTFITKK